MWDLIYNYFRYFFKNSIYSLYFILIVVVSSHAINLRENTQLYFEQIALKQGLPQSAITCLYQDKTGYIWIGTTDGLSRYNGYSFENYRNEPFDTTSISTGQVQALLEDSRGNLWIGSSDGLSRLDQKKGTFHHIALLNSPVNILAMVEGPDGYIWISGLNVGLIRLHPEVGTITRFQKKNE